MKKQPLCLLIIALLGISATWTGCTQGQDMRRGQTQPGPTVGEQPATETNRNLQANLQDLQRSQQDFRRSVTDLQISAREQNPNKYLSQSNQAFGQLEGTLRQMGTFSVALRPGETMVSEQAPMEDRMSGTIRAKLDQLNSLTSQVEDPHNIAKDQQRWRLVADTLESIHREIPNAGSAPQGIDQIRKMASQLNTNNHLTMEPRLFETTDQAMNTMVQQMENKYMETIPAGRPS